MACKVVRECCDVPHFKAHIPQVACRLRASLPVSLAESTRTASLDLRPVRCEAPRPGECMIPPASRLADKTATITRRPTLGRPRLEPDLKLVDRPRRA